MSMPCTKRHHLADNTCLLFTHKDVSCATASERTHTSKHVKLSPPQSGPFQFPVDVKTFKDYTSVVKHPIDLQTVCYAMLEC